MCPLPNLPLPFCNVSKHGKLICEFPHAGKCISHPRRINIPLHIYKKAVFPVPILNGTALNLRHAQIIIDKMGQHMVQRTALMGQFKADADLIRFDMVHLLGADNNEPGRIVLIVVYLIFQHF